MKTVKTEDGKSRGRPRSAAAQDAILAAASALFAQGGFAAVNMEAVARLAGVGKPTVYRNWPNREALAMSALLADRRMETGVSGTNSAMDDLQRHLGKVIAAFSTPRGRNVALMVASADQDSEIAKAFRNQVMLASREEGRGLLLRAVAENALGGHADIETALDMTYGAIFYRLLIGHVPVDAAFVGELLDVLKTGMSGLHKP